LSYEQAINAAQKQVAPGYIVTGSDWSYDGAGELSIRFRVTNIADKASTAIGPPQTVMVQSVTPAIAELAKINLSTFYVNEEEEVVRMLVLAQQQVSPIYTVSIFGDYNLKYIGTIGFTDGKDRKMLTVKFAVTNNINPSDAARDTTWRVMYTINEFTRPPAKEKIEEIFIPSVLVNMPVYWELARDEALKKITEKAQEQVGYYYEATIPAANYSMDGEVVCLLKLITWFLPYSEWTIVKTIKVYSTLSAAYELSKINVSNIETAISPISAGAQAIAVNLAVKEAQAKVSPEYTVRFITLIYAPNYPHGILYGCFQVEKNGEPSDMARDGNVRIINVRQHFALF
jgi:hypothetical protein